MVPSTVHNEHSIHLLCDALVNQNIMEQLNTNEYADLNENYSKLENILIDMKHQFLPNKLVKFRKHKHKQNAWIIRSIKYRDKLYQALKQTPIDSFNYLNKKQNL